MESIESLSRGELVPGSAFLGRAPLAENFAAPATGLDAVLEHLGSPLYTKQYPIDQYLVWADAVGLFELIQRRGSVTLADVSADTILNDGGADAILGVLAALGLLTRSPAGRYALTPGAREYCLRTSPYYIVDQLGEYGKKIPRPYYLRGRKWQQKLWWAIKSLLPNMRYGSRQRLINQHARNIPACAAAVRTGEFKGVKCLLDLAGGTGTFSIPLALENRVERIVLAELPQALDNVKPYLAEHGVQNRVELLAMDALQYPWNIPACDGMFIGNFLHAFPDPICRRLCEEAFRHLEPGGKVWVHEMIWNANKDGPLLTAMWNAAMRKGPGVQRTAQELVSILESAGFVDTYVVPTSGIFALIVGRKPAV